MASSVSSSTVPDMMDPDDFGLVVLLAPLPEAGAWLHLAAFSAIGKLGQHQGAGRNGNNQNNHDDDIGVPEALEKSHQALPECTQKCWLTLDGELLSYAEV